MMTKVVDQDALTAPHAPALDAGQLQLFVSMFASSPDLAAVVSNQGDILASNRPTPGRNGRKGFAEHFPLESRADVQYALLRAAQSCHFARVEAAGPRADGSRGWYLITVTPLLRDNTVQALNVIATDITERRREEERLRRSESLMVDTQGVAHLGTWEWDITQPHAVYSAELYRIYGLDPKSHVPSYEDYLTRVHPDDRQRVMEATNKVFHELTPYSHDERVFRADGSLRYLHTWAMPVVDDNGKLARLVGVCQDITDRRLAELAMEKHAQELQRSNSELEQFAHVTSHDLQEPLRTIASFVQLLKRRYGGQLGADADEIIDTVVDGAHRMKTLINDLLAYSRISAVPPTPQSVSLEDAVATAVANLQSSVAESGAEITCAKLPHVSMEPEQANSLLQNLISNAIKFRGADPPRIHVEARTHGRMVEVSVRDNGIGIDPAQFKRIFVVFQRLKASTPGTGIGLAICKKIVERSGGRIWVESEPGQGSTFRFTLPAAA
jgi:signal transduction histidine kinase